MYISRRALLISLLAFAATLTLAVLTSVYVPAAAAPSSAPQAATLSHFGMSAWAFRPYSSSATYADSASNCMYATSNTNDGRIFFADLPLPEGSIIKFLRVRYNNPSPSNRSYVTLYRVAGGASSAQTQISTTLGTSGIASSSEITASVDMSDAYYLLSWYVESALPDVQLCSAQVDYIKPPVFGTFLPSIVR